MEIAFLDEARLYEADANARRQEAVAKVLLSEEGISDFAKTALILVAMPGINPLEDPTDREVSELAEFLDRQLALAKA